MSRLYRSVMDDMEYYGISFEEAMERRIAAADAERDRRRDDELCAELDPGDRTEAFRND